VAGSGVSMQLELFAGPHLPIARCRAALEGGDLRAARTALLSAEADSRSASVAARISRLEEGLCDAGSAEAVHRSFEAALAMEGDLGGEPIGHSDWFRLYASHVGDALAATPERRFRGWCALHFHLAADRADAALRAVEELRSSAGGWAWLEAARAATAAGENALVRRWVFVACLLAPPEGFEPDPPRLAPVSSSAALNPAGPVLPMFPPYLEDLWAEATCLELPSPAAAWVPCIGLLDGVFETALLRSTEVREATGLDVSAAAPAREPAPRAFLRALASAREARERQAGRDPGSFGEAELRHRTAMRDAAAPLLSRYLARLRAG